MSRRIDKELERVIFLLLYEIDQSGIAEWPHPEIWSKGKGDSNKVRLAYLMREMRAALERKPGPSGIDDSECLERMDAVLASGGADNSTAAARSVVDDELCPGPADRDSKIRRLAEKHRQRKDLALQALEDWLRDRKEELEP